MIPTDLLSKMLQLSSIIREADHRLRGRNAAIIGSNGASCGPTFGDAAVATNHREHLMRNQCNQLERLS